VIGEQVTAYLRTQSAAKDRERVGPFVAHFTPGRDHPMLNYAVPDDNARPSGAEVAALAKAFRQRGLLPRLEYAASAAPGLEAVLVKVGFEVEARLPVMACRPVAAGLVEPPPDFIVAPAGSDKDHLDAIVVADEAYGEKRSLADAEMVAARRRMSAAGGAVVLAREQTTGVAAGSGLFPAPQARVSELAAIGTAEAFRRRGVATAVTSLLVTLASDNGVELLWLTPEHDQAERIYLKVGFERVDATMVHISQRRAQT
jgi:GNAT superfamily N-acetyltransferase